MVTYVVIRVTVKVFNATFNNISVIWCVQIYWRRKLEYSEITTDLQQVADKFYHIMLHGVHLTMTWI